MQNHWDHKEGLSKFDAYVSTELAPDSFVGYIQSQANITRMLQI